MMQRRLVQRTRWVLIVGLSLICGGNDSRGPKVTVQADERPAAESAGSATSEQANPAWRVTREGLDSLVWQQAIERATQHKALQVGAGEFTLLRVLLDGVEPVTPKYLAEGQRRGSAGNEEFIQEGQRTDRPRESVGAAAVSAVRTVALPVVNADSSRAVNGVRLFFPESVGEPVLNPKVPSQPTKTDIVQVTSTKVVSLQELSGGGVFRELTNGDFILIEHINSTRRVNDRDPVRVGSFTHHVADFMVPVPPRGQLGVLGDVVLSRPQPEAMGRIELDLRFVGNGWKSVSPQPKYQLQLGPCVVGGAYGVTREFNHDYQCDTGLLPPGEYKLLLADFDMVQSRWTVTVKPGQVTRLWFEASSPRVVQLAAESWVERHDRPR